MSRKWVGLRFYFLRHDSLYLPSILEYPSLLTQRKLSLDSKPWQDTPIRLGRRSAVLPLARSHGAVVQQYMNILQTATVPSAFRTHRQPLTQVCTDSRPHSHSRCDSCRFHARAILYK